MKTDKKMAPVLSVDGNEAAARVAHKLSEVVAIYPITPASSMGELADQWSAAGEKNIWGEVPGIVELQSEGGAAGAVHGALQSGALTTTFTASQGLLLMLPNMFKIAGELTPTVFHIAARSVATHALSIFGDHSDIMAARATGFAMLGSNSVQEAQDMALVAHAATLASRVPFLHFFDGFRTSHEIQKILGLTDSQISAMIDPAWIAAHRKRRLTPDSPFIRGTAQNPDVFFQAREACNPYYLACPAIVEDMMDKFYEIVGRRYNLFEYLGDPEADRVMVMMGSGAEAAGEAVKALNAQGEKVGLLKVRLYRPFSAKHFLNALPATVKAIAVMDRTKEPGAQGEPLYTDIATTILEYASREDWHLAGIPKVVGGRYGLSSKAFTPAMAKAILDELKAPQPRNHFTIGIKDDVTHTSLAYDPSFSTENPETFRGLFYGLGSDGTVSANKNAIKIIGQETDQYAQGYFVYDSKKAGSVTVSHLRFGKDPITATYLVEKANFIAVHHHNFLEKFDLLENADPGAVFLLNSPVGAKDIWQQLPAPARRQIVAKKLKFYLIDAYEVAKQEGMGRRINTIMQTCFFAISGILPREEAIRHIKNAIKKTYGKKGEELIKKNFAVVDATLSHLKEVDYPLDGTNIGELPNPISPAAPEFVKDILGTIIAGKGDELPVSAMPVDGTFPSGTACWEKRNIAQDIPEWDPDVCIQCGKCVLVCPHGVIRATATEPAHFEGAPESFKYTKVRGRDWPEGTQYTLQIAPEDCTGCTLCVEVCPAKDKKEVGRKALNMVPQAPIREREKQNWEFFNQMPLSDRGLVNGSTAREVQFLEPLFEFSGACAGCGETPYIKLATQLFGDRMIVANATGCSSIYGGNLPTTPWTHNKEGRGPAWANSLFEDNAEFGLGFRMTLDQHEKQARNLLKRVGLDKGLVKALLDNPQKSEEDLNAQRERVEELKKALKSVKTAEAKDLLSLADNLVRKSVWIIGGDGWAYDIGFGGLDHVIASGKNVNILVLDTEVYSNTGGQMSKATPLGAAAKFAASGKEVAKKDLALQAVSYGNVYVARIAMGANDSHTIKVLQEAEQYQGPSLVIAYSHCIAHGYNMARGLDQQKLAVETGYWPLFRFNPDLRKEGKNPFTLDSKGIKKPLQDYIYNEARYKMLTKVDPDHARVLLNNAQKTVVEHRKLYDKMVEMYEPGDDEGNGVPKQVLPFY